MVAIMTNLVYGFYLYFLIPIFLLILLGKPRFLVKIIHTILNIHEPFKGIKIFGFYFVACGLYSALCFLNKFKIEEFISSLDHSKNNMELYNAKTRELNLNERNGFMFLNFFILMILIERLCDSHFKKWEVEDMKRKIEFKIEIGMEEEAFSKKEQ